MNNIHVPLAVLGLVHRPVADPPRHYDDYGWLYQWHPSTFNVEKIEEVTDLMHATTMGIHEALDYVNFRDLPPLTLALCPKKSGPILINGREVDVTYHSQPWAVIHNKKRGSR